MKLSEDLQVWVENADVRHPTTIDNEQLEEWGHQAAKLEAEVELLIKAGRRLAKTLITIDALLKAKE